MYFGNLTQETYSYTYAPPPPIIFNYTSKCLLLTVKLELGVSMVSILTNTPVVEVSSSILYPLDVSDMVVLSEIVNSSTLRKRADFDDNSFIFLTS